MQIKPLRRKVLLYRSVLMILIAACLVLLWRLNIQVLSNPAYIPVDDFAHYWAAGKLVMIGQNPYDAGAVQAVRDQAVGQQTSYDVIPIAWTPPWSLPLLIPFGLLDYSLARLIWLLGSVLIILLSSDILWQVYSGGRKFLWLVWIIAAVFGPTISVLQKGQITPWLLAGSSGFLFFMTVRKNDWAAGLFAGLITLKPQLFYLFWPALLFWSVRNKRWGVLLGAGAGVLLAFGAVLALNPGAVSGYVQAILHNSPRDWATPTIGGYLRLVLGLEHFWLQFLPVGLGLVWFIFFWLNRQDRWDWRETFPVLLFASILTSAYSWTYDQVILLPAILAALHPLLAAGHRRMLWLMLGLLMAINLADLLLHRPLDEFWFGWLAPAYGLWWWACEHYAKNNALHPRSFTSGGTA